MENEIYEESFHEFDELVDYLSTLPQATVKILNIKRYNQMLKTAIDLFNLLKETDPDIKIKIKINHMFNMGSVSVSADDLTIKDFNGDGKLDSFEKAAEFGMFMQMMDSQKNDELTAAGLNPDDLEDYEWSLLQSHI